MKNKSKKIFKMFKTRNDYYYLLRKYNTLELNYETILERQKDDLYKTILNIEDVYEEHKRLLEDNKKLRKRLKDLKKEIKDSQS